MNGGIDFGGEFDSFLLDYNKLIQNHASVAKDRMRA
jgi:hypothetical protein